jgi:hypothetical protein
MEARVLFNVLKSVGTGDEHKAAPDRGYLKALDTVGIIKMGWDNELTELGSLILQTLRNKFEKW